MWTQIVRPSLLMLVLLYSMDLCADSLFKKYPYGLIGENYGNILSEDDLAINACGKENVVPFPQSDVYPYWQCYEVKRVRFYCDDQGYFKENKSHMNLLVFEVDESELVSSYISPRAWETSVCKSYSRDWNTVDGIKSMFVFLGSL